jgi:hypothetical protein
MLHCMSQRLTSLATRQVGRYLAYTGRAANVAATAGRDPVPTSPVRRNIRPIRQNCRQCRRKCAVIPARAPCAKPSVMIYRRIGNLRPSSFCSAAVSAPIVRCSGLGGHSCGQLNSPGRPPSQSSFSPKLARLRAERDFRFRVPRT